MAIFTAEEKRGVAAASEQRVRAQQILSDAATSVPRALLCVLWCAC